jgi:hypothetical protein
MRIIILLAFVSSCGPYKSHANTDHISASDYAHFKQQAICVDKPKDDQTHDCKGWHATCLKAFEEYFNKPTEALENKIIDVFECFEF